MSFRQFTRICNNPILFLIFILPLIGGYIIYLTGWLLWLVLKGLWFVLAVLPYRLIMHGRENISKNKLARAEDRMSEYADGR